MNQAERLDAITEYVIGAGSAKIDELSERFGVTTVTIHRDLDALQARGILRKSRGYVTAVASSLFEANPEFRKRQHVRAKMEIAAEAFKFVDPGHAIVLDDSTTGVLLAELFPTRLPLTVITHFQTVIDVVVKYPAISLISLGGQHYQWSNAFMGPLTISAMKALRTDVFFMSTPSIIDDACFHQHYDATLIKQAMFDSASRRFLMADSSKFELRALHRSISLKDFDAVIVDSAIPTERAQSLRDMGINLIVAEPLSPSGH
jgi:DeoR/GlpR family transcriptional regulator of sugar metabolism